MLGGTVMGDGEELSALANLGGIPGEKATEDGRERNLAAGATIETPLD